MSKTKSSVISFPTGQFPDRAYVKLKYIERSNFDIAIGAYEYDTWSINSPYDPYVASGGKGTAGWTQWSAMYDFYKCYGSKINISVINVGSTPAVGSIAVSLLPSIDLTPATTMDNFMAQKYAKKLFVQSTGTSQRNLQHYMSVEKLLGLHKGTVARDDRYASDVGSDPYTQLYWHIAVEPVDKSSTTTVQIYVEIIYFIEFYGIKTVTEPIL